MDSQPQQQETTYRPGVLFQQYQQQNKLQQVQDNSNYDKEQVVEKDPSEVAKVQKKRGRPAAKNEAARDWTDEETYFLIDLWAQNENLFNTKHRLYFNRDARAKSLNAIEETLNSNEIPATTKQITKKLTDLKNYFGAQKRMMDGSKKSGAGADEVFSSTWKFYDSLHFLSDAFTPRKTQNNVNQIETEMPYENAKQPSAKSDKKMAASQKIEIQKAMTSAATALESIASKRKITESEPDDEDDAFCNLLRKQLKAIPNCDTKDDLKIAMQQMVVSCKRQVKGANVSRQNQYPFLASPQHQDQNISFYGSPPSNSSSVTSGF